MAVQARPRPPFELVEAGFFPELLMGLLASPSRCGGAGQLIDRRAGRVVFALAGGTMFPNEPDVLAEQMLGAHVMDTLRPSATRTRTAPRACLWSSAAN